MMSRLTRRKTIERKFFRFSLDGEMQVSTQSILPDGSDKFFTIDESYCPSMQNHQLSFDPIIQKTIYHYIETVHFSRFDRSIDEILLSFSFRMKFKWLFIFFWRFIRNWAKRKSTNCSAVLITNGSACTLVNRSDCPFDSIRFAVNLDLLQKLRLFVKSAQVAKHAVEKQRIHINYDPSEYDGKMILIASSPVTKRLPNSNSMSNGISSGKASSNNSNSKDYMCAIWLVDRS